QRRSERVSSSSEGARAALSFGPAREVTRHTPRFVPAMHRRLSARTHALLLAPALALSASLALSQTQQQQQPRQPDEEVVRISSDLVQTDVMVFDKSGKFVEGLKPEQFELKVDGRAQSVSFFEAVRAGTYD